MAKAKKTRKVAKKVEIDLGREGTPARFIREQYLAGKDTATILKAAQKKFPKNKIKTPSYVAWYRSQMRKEGVRV